MPPGSPGARQRRDERAAVGRRVDRDEAVEPAAYREVGDGVDLGVAEVRRDLHEQRHAQPERAELLLHAVHERLERVGRLQRPQPRGVGRAHVEREVVRVGREAADARAVVGRGVVDRRRLRLADVDADDRAPRPGQPRGDRIRAAVGEPHPVQERARLREALDARPRVARLGLRGDRPDLHEAEADRPEPLEPGRVLVDARGDAERAGEDPPERLDAQRRVARAEQPAQRPGGERPEQRRGHAVGALGIEPGEDEAEEEAVDHTRARPGALDDARHGLDLPAGGHEVHAGDAAEARARR